MFGKSSKEDSDGARDVRAILEYLQKLTGVICNSRSVSELFRGAFRSLSEAVRFDVAIAAALEQHLHLYVTCGKGEPDVVDERLVNEIKELLGGELRVSLDATDAVTIGLFQDLEHETSASAAERLHAFMIIDGRAAGVIVLGRSEGAFSEADRTLLQFFANQLSLLLGTVRAQEQVQKLADTDEMTGIWNRRYFRRQMEAEIERSRIYKIALSVMLFDLDNFKDINDTFGHPMGDVVLSELCGVVKASLRQPDLFARIGGDEFAILLPHTEHRGAEHLADRILSKVRRMTIPGESNAAITCSVSIGIASLSTPPESADEFLRRADERLYVAKKSGKNRHA